MLPYVRTNRSHCWPLTNRRGLTQIFTPDVLGVLAPGGKARGMEHRGRGYHIHRSPRDKGCLLMYCSQPGELFAGRCTCTLVQLTTIQLIRRCPYVHLTSRWIIGWLLYPCTAHDHTTYQKISVLMYMYSSRPGEFLASRCTCTLVQLTTIQLIRRFPYSCMYSSESDEFLTGRCTLV